MLRCNHSSPYVIIEYNTFSHRYFVLFTRPFFFTLLRRWYICYFDISLIERSLLFFIDYYGLFYRRRIFQQLHILLLIYYFLFIFRFFIAPIWLYEIVYWLYFVFFVSALVVSKFTFPCYPSIYFFANNFIMFSNGWLNRIDR